MSEIKTKVEYKVIKIGTNLYLLESFLNSGHKIEHMHSIGNYVLVVLKK